MASFAERYSLLLLRKKPFVCLSIFLRRARRLVPRFTRGIKSSLAKFEIKIKPGDKRARKLPCAAGLSRRNVSFKERWNSAQRPAGTREALPGTNDQNQANRNYRRDTARLQTVLC